MFKRMLLKRLLGEVWRFENAMKKHYIKKRVELSHDQPLDS